MPRYNPNRLYKPSTRTICTICREEAKEKTSDHYPHGPRFVVTDNDTRAASPDRITSHGQLWYHQSCYEILASSYVTAEIPIKKQIREFYEATTPIYPAPKYQRRVLESMREGLFSEHTKGVFEACFSQALLRRLPEEILCTILEYVGKCRYLRVLGETRRLFDQWRTSCEDNYGHERISASKHVFLTRMEYRGVSYISKISDVPFGKPSDEGFPGEMLSFPPNTRRLLVSKDHMGVRDIRPIVDGLELSADGSPWYEVLGEPNKSINCEIEVSYNGLFLRWVRSTATDRDRKIGPWTIPCPPSIMPWNVDCIERKQEPSWLHYVQLDGGVKGLAVCCWNYRNIGFHSFTRLSADYKRFVSHMKQQYLPRFLTWMYFPINAGESITDVWTLNEGTLDRYGASSGPAIVVETSLRRTITFGAYMPPKSASSTQLGFQMGPHQARSLLRSDDGAISGLFHNGLDPLSPYITEFGVVCDPHRARERPEQIAGAEQYPYPTPLVTSDLGCDEWYMTKARLEGLVSVQFCQDTTRVHYPCIGLLLHYGDGHVESLGQFRWDLIISDRIPTPIRVEISHDMVRGRFIPYIGAVEKLPPFYYLGGDQWHEWKIIPGHGVIVWWTNPKMGDQIVLYNS